MSIASNGSANGFEKDPLEDLVREELLKAIKGKEGILEEDPTDPSLPNVIRRVDDGKKGVRQESTQLMGIAPEHLEIARRLETRILSLETPRLLEQIQALHDDCLLPASCLEHAVKGNPRPLSDVIKHGVILDRFDPPQEELAIYRQNMPGYLSPKNLLIANLNGSIKRPGNFALVGLIDPAKNEGENIVGYIDARFPPHEDEEVDRRLYQMYMTNLLQLDGKPGLEKGELQYKRGWETDALVRQVGKMWEIGTILVKRGYRKAGGAEILLNDIEQHMIEKVGPEGIRRVICSVFDGFSAKSEGQPADLGSNPASKDFFKEKFGFCKLAGRYPDHEVVVFPINGKLTPLVPHWEVLYQGEHRLRKALDASPILHYLGRREM
ncbi:GNAT family N-acetyltransferase [Candidatus Peribacteria bacterium]|nr:MAG: GNAT family N-acetyltransferase [Candidatus Peribacteria bacterium]